jgi:hypothetical protein
VHIVYHTENGVGVKSWRHTERLHWSYQDTKAIGDKMPICRRRVQGYVTGLLITLIGVIVLAGGCEHDWEAGTPVPANAVLVNRAPNEGYTAASRRLWYNEQYAMNTLPQAVMQFYQELGWDCTERSISFAGLPSTSDLLYWQCGGSLDENVRVQAMIVSQGDALTVFESSRDTWPAFYAIFHQKPEQTNPPAEAIIFTEVSNNVGTW